MIQGDCVEVLRRAPAASVDAVVCDPPYGLSKEPHAAEVLRRWLAGDDYHHRGSGFMGKSWDSFVPGPATWREVFRVLKPGGHALVFAGTRTQDLMGIALRLAGFEIRDCLDWVYATGFPKSLDVGKAIDNAAGVKREVIGVEERYNMPSGIVNAGRGAEARTKIQRKITKAATDTAKRWDGWGTALKPAHEPIILARKPLAGTVAANVLEHGTGALNIGGCRVPAEKATGWGGGGSKLYEGGLSREGGEARPQEKGRWPPNLLLGHAACCGDDECGPCCPVVEVNRQSGFSKTPKTVSRGPSRGTPADYTPNPSGEVQRGVPCHVDSGGGSRFFQVFRYQAKPERKERDAGLAEAGFDAHEVQKRNPSGLAKRRSEAGTVRPLRNPHPTVKPVELMRWLVRLVTPLGGVVLDPFAGSGSTGIAAVKEGARFIGIEMNEEYAQIARARIAAAVEEET